MINDKESKVTAATPWRNELAEAIALNDDMRKALSIWAAKLTYDLLTDLFEQGLMTREEYKKQALETAITAIKNLK